MESALPVNEHRSHTQTASNGTRMLTSSSAKACQNMIRCIIAFTLQRKEENGSNSLLVVLGGT